MPRTRVNVTHPTTAFDQHDDLTDVDRPDVDLDGESSDRGDRYGDPHSDPYSDPYERYAEYDTLDDDVVPIRSRRDRQSAPRVVLEGKSGRHEIDADAEEFIDPARTSPTTPPGPATCHWTDDEEAADDVDAPFSSYDVATHGPHPVPEWLVTELCRPRHPARQRQVRQGGRRLAARPFAARRARLPARGEDLPRAASTGCSTGTPATRRAVGSAGRGKPGRWPHGRRFGRELLAGKWAGAEFEALSRLWTSGARVPYPVQIICSELMMQFIGTPDGTAAPRLAAYDGRHRGVHRAVARPGATLEVLAEDGLTHGDLSPFNVLVDETGCVLIDLPQVVDVVANPQGRSFLDRDCRNIADFFARRGVLAPTGTCWPTPDARLALP